MSPKEVKVTVQLLQDSDAVVNEFKVGGRPAVLLVLRVLNETSASC